MVAQTERFTAETFNEYRPLLFAISYRMLGSWMDAEDIVQEAFLRWSQVEPGAVASPKSYLSAVVTRLSIDHLRLARVQREEYIGPWLPEPALTDEPALGGTDPAVLSESLSQAFLVVLESLGPVERAVFLLHEVFAYSFEEIAGIIGKNPANCRQIGRRARQHIAERRPRNTPSPEERDRLLNEFVGALASGDVQGLASVLADDATLWSDGGGKVTTAVQPVRGADKIVRGMIGFRKKHSRPITGYRLDVSGQPIFVSELNGRPFGVITVDIVGGLIRDIRITANPDKLQRLTAIWPELVASGQAKPVTALDQAAEH
jgi:RNA polymerase sigma-70 factor (ECF subfamily)